ncbi:hypothetical protein L6452_10615 [Arctium lappa]|uniref:Uncharacterized protein n=1 Tax=Arctium lappa TaxID=4217 RepID=A0ACB9DN37_ARCLA|nr:hypothetical protein L6452_10615 [Arctium lappa]
MFFIFIPHLGFANAAAEIPIHLVYEIDYLDMIMGIRKRVMILHFSIIIINMNNRSRSTSLDSHHLCKKIKLSASSSTATATAAIAGVLMDQNLLYEVLKHVEAKMLGATTCVCKQWNQTVQDEWLWELIYTRHWKSIICKQQSN